MRRPLAKRAILAAALGLRRPQPQSEAGPILRPADGLCALAARPEDAGPVWVARAALARFLGS